MKSTSKLKTNTEMRAQYSALIHSYWAKIDEFDRKYQETGDVNYKILVNHNKTLVMGIMAKIKSTEVQENENSNS